MYNIYNIYYILYKYIILSIYIIYNIYYLYIFTPKNRNPKTKSKRLLPAPKSNLKFLFIDIIYVPILLYP